ncbi:hypothetical protein VTH06DRAFT_1077, partial [Thermothelomyces fergusii]
MEAAYPQHKPSWRHRDRSAAGLDGISIAPLTTRLPLRNEDYEAINSASSLSRPHTSYLYGRSAPSTPRLLSHSPPPSSRPRRPARGASVPYIPEPGAAAAAATGNNHHNHHHRPATTAAARKRRAGKAASSIFPDADLLQHVGALIASEARDAKGQGWLVTRASSTASLPAEPETYRPA